MPIVFEEKITRALIQKNRDRVYVFGDNLERRGYGGQAKEARDEPNAIGVATKRRPSNDDDAFFTGAIDEILAVTSDLHKIGIALHEGKTVVIPKAGLGTGRANLKEKAPIIFQLIRVFVQAMYKSGLPKGDDVQ